MIDRLLIYVLICNDTSKLYVGQTSSTLDKRWSKHVNDTISGRSKLPLHNAIRKYGVNSFEMYVLESCSNDQELNDAEIDWIDILGSFHDGYNCTIGGNGCRGYKFTIDIRKKMSLAATGRKLSNDSRKKLSNSKKKENLSDETRRKLREVKHKSIAMCDLEGNVLRIFPSVKSTAIIVGIGNIGNVSACARNERPHCKGYVWKYTDSV